MVVLRHIWFFFFLSLGITDLLSEGPSVFVSPINSINSKQCENSLPVKANLSVINHQINSLRSRANIRGCNSGSTGDSKKAMTNATTAKNNSDNVICYSAVTRYRQSFLPLQEAVHLHRCNSGVSQKE